MRLRSDLILCFLLAFASSSCGIGFIKHQKVNDETKQEGDAYGKHWIYTHRMTGHLGPGIAAGHGALASGSVVHSKTIQLMDGTPLNVLERISVLQKDGRYKHFEITPKSPPWFDVFMRGHRIYAVMVVKPGLVTDRSLQMPDHEYYSNGEAEFLGEWDPIALEFKFDRYFPKRIWIFTSPLKEEDIPKAAVLKVD